MVASTTPSPARQIWVLAEGLVALLLGLLWRQRAAIIIGTAAAVVVAVHFLILAYSWPVLIPLVLMLLILRRLQRRSVMVR